MFTAISSSVLSRRARLTDSTPPSRRRRNANNALFGVHWVMSYANSAKTKTYCIYEGPSEAAIRKAATANGLPIDSITEVPVTLLPK
jgi:hypothetical protein